jgi:hypothetical protein
VVVVAIEFNDAWWISETASPDRENASSHQAGHPLDAVFVRQSELASGFFIHAVSERLRYGPTDDGYGEALK